MKKDLCKSMTKNDIHKALKQERLTNNAIVLTGNKEFLCDQYIKLKNPRRTVISPDRHDTMSELLNTIRQKFKKMTTVTEMRNFNSSIRDICDEEIVLLKKNNKIPKQEDIYAMLKQKEPMKNIITEMNKMDNDFDREDAGLFAMEDTQLLMAYSKAERRKFIKLMGRDITEDCFDEYNTLR
jgi:hypothetical protein